MTKKVIAIISVLKPIDDTRNYEKVARSISNTNKYDINIIGFSSKKSPANPNITFHPVFNFRRSNFRRFFSSITIFRKLIQLKPELTIVTCPELLMVMYCYKIIFGGKLIYDIQENYYLNIRYTNSYSAMIRYPLATVTRLVERVSRLFVSRYFLAEEVYEEQLKFTRGRSLVLENKAIMRKPITPQKFVPGDYLKLVFAGTIAEHYGIFEAMGLAEKLHAHRDQLQLTIVGFAANRKILKKVQELINTKPYIRLVGGDSLVPHGEVLMEMSKSHFCLMPYHRNKSTGGRIPTKLYECLAMELPIIISSNEAWDRLVQENNAGITHDFNGEINALIPALSKSYYGLKRSGTYLWERTESKLLTTIDKLLFSLD